MMKSWPLRSTFSVTDDGLPVMVSMSVALFSALWMERTLRRADCADGVYAGISENLIYALLDAKVTVPAVAGWRRLFWIRQCLT